LFETDRVFFAETFLFNDFLGIPLKFALNSEFSSFQTAILTGGAEYADPIPESE